jgi:hypothetical protein
MAPIYDTDLAEERSAKTQWENYELWEKVSIRLLRRKRAWIALTVLVFLVLSSVPIVVERRPKWVALAASRRLAEEISRLKREASMQKVAFRIRVLSEDASGPLRFEVDRLPSCSSSEPDSKTRDGVEARPGELKKVHSGNLSSVQAGVPLSVVLPEQAAEFGLRDLLASHCYDYLAGNSEVLQGKSIGGFALIPSVDLGLRRSDRVAFLLLSGASGELIFE